MKKSELRKIIREEIKYLIENKKSVLPIPPKDIVSSLQKAFKGTTGKTLR